MIGFTRTALTLSLSWICFTGCTRRPDMVIVSGTVRCQGEELPLGTIRFLPLAGTDAPASGAWIREGHYVVSTRGGVIPGRYRVEIEARAGTRIEPAAPDDDQSGPPEPQPIPAIYNTESSLVVDVPATPARQQFDFDLEQPAVPSVPSGL